MAKSTGGRVITYADGRWHDGNAPIIGPFSQGFWLSSSVFDGARAIAGKAPDLERHCQRLLHSAEVLGLGRPLGLEEILNIAWDGIRKFPGDAVLYLCPMLFAEEGLVVLPDPKTTRFTMVVKEAPIPEYTGFSACLTRFRRPGRDQAPTDAKASCLYPNVARGVQEATSKGFDVAVVLDPIGNVAEFSYANLFLVKDGVVSTPAPNGTFLNGITRQRVIQLLRDDGFTVEERTVDFAEVLEADELFNTGNYAKVQPCTRIEDRELQPGPVARRAHELYFRFADAC